jgi:hypothetical protein
VKWVPLIRGKKTRIIQVFREIFNDNLTEMALKDKKLHSDGIQRDNMFCDGL